MTILGPDGRPTNGMRAPQARADAFDIMQQAIRSLGDARNDAERITRMSVAMNVAEQARQAVGVQLSVMQQSLNLTRDALLEVSGGTLISVPPPPFDLKEIGGIMIEDARESTQHIVSIVPFQFLRATDGVPPFSAVIRKRNGEIVKIELALPSDAPPAPVSL